MSEVAGWVEETALLRRLAGSGWMFYAFGDARQPTVIAAVQRFLVVSNVVVIRGHDRVAAYRVLMSLRDDPLQAREVIWHYVGHARDTLRAVLELRLDVDCGLPHPIPAVCRVPELDRRPITIISPGGGRHLTP